MTVKHEHTNYASKTTLRAALALVLTVLSLLVGIILFSLQKSDLAIQRAYGNEIDIRQHDAEYNFVRESIQEIKTTLNLQHNKMDEQRDLLVKQGHKIDEMFNRIDDCLEPSISPTDITGSD